MDIKIEIGGPNRLLPCIALTVASYEVQASSYSDPAFFEAKISYFLILVLLSKKGNSNLPCALLNSVSRVNLSKICMDRLYCLARHLLRLPSWLRIYHGFRSDISEDSSVSFTLAYFICLLRRLIDFQRVLLTNLQLFLLGNDIVQCFHCRIEFLKVVLPLLMLVEIKADVIP